MKVQTRFSHDGKVYEVGDEIREGAITATVLGKLKGKKMISGAIPDEESATPKEKVEKANIIEKVEKKSTPEKAQTGKAVKN